MAVCHLGSSVTRGAGQGRPPRVTPSRVVTPELIFLWLNLQRSLDKSWRQDSLKKEKGHHFSEVISFFRETRNTFCGTWYLPHSICPQWTNCSYNYDRMHGACTKRLYFHFRSEIWRHHRVLRPRFPYRRGNFGDSTINKRYIAYFSLRMRESAVFPLPV